MNSLAADIDAVGGMTTEQVTALAKSGIYKWDDLLIVLVGDREKIVPQLKEAGFPEPTLIDAAGQLAAH